MFKIDLPNFKFFLSGRECQNDRDSLIQRILCWIFDCCSDEARKGKVK